MRAIANQLFRRRNYIDFATLIQAGMTRLGAATSGHERDTAEVFEAYASALIREAMLDVVRRSDWGDISAVGTANTSKRKEGGPRERPVYLPIPRKVYDDLHLLDSCTPDALHRCIRRNRRWARGERRARAEIGRYKTEEIDQKWLAGMAILAEIGDRVAEYRIAEGYRVSASGPKAWAEAELLADEHRRVIQDLQYSYTALLGNDARTADLVSFRTAWTAYYTQHDAWVRMVKDGTLDDAATL